MVRTVFKLLLAWPLLVALAALVPAGSAAAAPGSPAWSVASAERVGVSQAVFPPKGGGPSVRPAASQFWALQLNLCNGGDAPCYAGGRAVIEGGDRIRATGANVVTLNEICHNDLPSYLAPSLAEAAPDDWVYYVFVPALTKQDTPFKCRNGDDFGNAVLGRIPAATYQGVASWGGVYTDQDGGNERRTFACANAIGNNYLACTTHLSAASEAVALAQCRTLMFDAIPYIRSADGIYAPTVVGGDFNMEYDTGDPENVQNCVPAGHTRKGDGDVQHVIFSNQLTFNGTNQWGLLYSDHDAFMVRMTKP